MQCAGVVITNVYVTLLRFVTLLLGTTGDNQLGLADAFALILPPRMMLSLRNHRKLHACTV